METSQKDLHLFFDYSLKPKAISGGAGVIP